VAELARANITLARTQGAQGSATVVTGDARQLPTLLDPQLVGRVALVLTSPPYGRSVHGQVTARRGRGVEKYDNTYSPDPANLGRVPQPTLLDALGEVLAGCRALLRPGGLVVLTARPYRHRERLVDLPGQLSRVAEAAGLVPYERNAALVVGLRGERLVPRPSFFQLDRVRKARARGGCRCGSSPTRTSWSSAAPHPRWVRGERVRAATSTTATHSCCTGSPGRAGATTASATWTRTPHAGVLIVEPAGQQELSEVFSRDITARQLGPSRAFGGSNSPTGGGWLTGVVAPRARSGTRAGGGAPHPRGDDDWSEQPRLE
jgi:hypothetical protein